MADGSYAESEAEITRVPTELQPQSEEEAVDRATYLACSLALNCADLVTGTLMRCRSGELGDSVRKASAKAFSQQEFAAAAKELTCIAIYASVLDQGADEAEEWLKDFLFLCLRVSDKIFTQPRARDIMLTHDTITTLPGICQDASTSACRSLGLGGMAKDVAVPMKDYLMLTRKYRCDLLLYALSQPVPVLSQHIQALKVQQP